VNGSTGISGGLKSCEDIVKFIFINSELPPSRLLPLSSSAATAAATSRVEK